MKSVLVLAILIVFLLVGVVGAGTPGEIKRDKKEIKQDKQELKQSKDCFKRLNILVDKWHEANLNCNDKKMDQLQQAIINTLVKDINASFHAVDRAEREAARTRLKVLGDNEPARAAVDDERDFARSRTMLASKQGLLYKMKESDSFSVKYRLLSDYKELLKMELGMAGRELAEDVRESRFDRR